MGLNFGPRNIFPSECSLLNLGFLIKIPALPVVVKSRNGALKMITKAWGT